MNVVFGIEVGMWMLIWGAIFRLIELQFKGTALSQALGVIY